VRIAVAGLALESVSFLPDLVTYEDFEQVALRGPGLIEALAGTATPGGGFIDALSRAGAEIVPLVYVDGDAAGSAADEAVEAYMVEICDGLARAGPLDGLLLYLHGAMTTPARPDPERDILEAVRAAVGPDLPVAAAFDLHANLSPATAGLVTALVGFHYSPHVDMAETGERAARLLLAAIEGRARPRLSIAKAPVVLPSIFTATGLPPLSGIVADSVAAPERDPRILDASVFCGFAYSDTPDIGFSVAVVSDGAREAGDMLAAALAGRVWEEREALLHAELVHGLDEGVARACERARGAERPVVLLEHADRRNDSTWGLAALLARPDLPSAYAPYLWNPETAARAVAAGAGARIGVRLGGRSSERAGGPVEAEAEVLRAGPLRFEGGGPLTRGCAIDLGPAALLRIGPVLVSVTTTSAVAMDLDCFHAFGLDPGQVRLILLRSKTHFRAVFEPLAEEIVIVETPDWGPADLSTLPYRRVLPGVFPIDPATLGLRAG
jgi:microcystin degradation protein MlrC